MPIFNGVNELGKKQEKVNELLRQEVSKLLLTEFKDPRLGFVTVTRCEVSPDISYAKVFISIMGDQESENRSMKVLKNAADYIRMSISKKVQMRYVPVLDFRIDETIDATFDLLNLMQRDKEEHQY